MSLMNLLCFQTTYQSIDNLIEREKLSVKVENLVDALDIDNVVD
jgi:hypothetical protein